MPVVDMDGLFTNTHTILEITDGEFPKNCVEYPSSWEEIRVFIRGRKLYAIEAHALYEFIRPARQLLALYCK